LDQTHFVTSQNTVSLLIHTTQQYTKQCALINLLKTLGKTCSVMQSGLYLIHKYHIFTKDTRMHIIWDIQLQSSIALKLHSALQILMVQLFRHSICTTDTDGILSTVITTIKYLTQ